VPDTEKVSFNISVVDLGQVDLLIEQGFYSSRTDFLVAAVRSCLHTHAATVQQAVAHRSMTLGIAIYSRKSLEEIVAAGRQLELRVVGVLEIAKDVTPELARAAIKSVSVFGKLRASPEVTAALLFRKRSEG
jgi:Arc/MetJ-type ribon-helix-helix transcriptional regulator